MDRQYFSSFLLLLIFSACITDVVWAAAGDLGATCTSTGGCTSTDHVCDPVDNVCRKKASISCNSTDNPLNCVTQATCAAGTGQTCTCPTTTHIVSGGLCQLKVDGTCSSTTAKCVAKAACPAAGGVCACNTSYVARSDKLACLLKAGQSCNADADCTANSVCSTATPKTCTCSANYVAQTSGVCLLKAGQTCNVDADCTANSTCSTATPKNCTCSANYFAQTSGVCSGAMAVAGSIFILIAALLLQTHLE